QRIERCGYLQPPAGGQADVAQHGYGGWLPTDVITDLITPVQLLTGVDAQLIQAVVGAFHATAWDLDFNPFDPGAIDRVLDRAEAILENAPNLKEIFSLGSLKQKKEALDAHIRGLVNSYLDPNRYPLPPERREGVFLIPLSVSRDERKRVGARE